MTLGALLKLEDIKPDLWVRVHTLGPPNGMLIDLEHLDCRAEGAVGIVKGSVPGHGDAVWWVEHRGPHVGTTGAYLFHEFEQIEAPPVKPDSDNIFD